MICYTGCDVMDFEINLILLIFLSNFTILLLETFQRPFRRNFLAPLEGTFQRPFRRNFLDQKEFFRLLRKNFLDPLRRNLGLLNFVGHFHKKTHSLFLIILYYCNVQFVTFCYINNVNTILKIDCVFLFFLILAGLLLKTLLRIQEQPQRMNQYEKILTGFNKISSKITTKFLTCSESKK